MHLVALAQDGTYNPVSCWIPVAFGSSAYRTIHSYYIGVPKVQEGAPNRTLMRAYARDAGETPRLGLVRSEKREARLGGAPFSPERD